MPFGAASSVSQRLLSDWSHPGATEATRPDPLAPRHGLSPSTGTPLCEHMFVSGYGVWCDNV